MTESISAVPISPLDAARAELAERVRELYSIADNVSAIAEQLVGTMDDFVADLLVDKVASPEAAQELSDAVQQLVSAAGEAIRSKIEHIASLQALVDQTERLRTLAEEKRQALNRAKERVDELRWAKP